MDLGTLGERDGVKLSELNSANDLKCKQAAQTAIIVNIFFKMHRKILFLQD